MSSPDDFDRRLKETAPSIWSLDSGYSSGALEGQMSRDKPGNGVGLGFTNFSIRDLIRPKRSKGAALEPLANNLNVFTNKDTMDGHYLPAISCEGDGCVKCEFWRVTNPGENVLCEDCRIPTVEPTLVYTVGFQDKVDMPPLRIDTEIKQERTRTRKRARCSACELSTLMDPSGPSLCSTCSPDPGLLSPISAGGSYYKVRRSRAGRNSKLPQAALDRLQAWLKAHQDNPYPSAEEKKQLAQECGITEKQVTTWYTNARARQLNPLDTELSSGSEDDGGQESDLASASRTPVHTSGFSRLSDNGASGYRRAGSISGNSTLSGPSRRGKKKNYRRTNLSPQITEQHTLQSPTATVDHTTGDQSKWPCTFCGHLLAPKSWRRHEETQHHARSEWICMLSGPRLQLPRSSGSCCAFCLEKNPTEEHFMRNHRIAECAERKIAERRYGRPDHLRQHVNNFHKADLHDLAQTRWKRAVEEGGLRDDDKEGWTCGFCGESLETWDIRETHIAGHFKEGMTLAQWDQEIADNNGQNHKRASVKKEDHIHGLARLSRSFTRRSTRSSQRIAPPTHQYQNPQPHTFANAFDALPTTTPMSMPQTFSSPPVLPNINMDPLMSGYNDFIDWTQVTTEPLYTDTLAFCDPTLNTDFSAALNPGVWNPEAYNPWSQG